MKDSKKTGFLNRGLFVVALLIIGLLGVALSFQRYNSSAVPGSAQPETPTAGTSQVSTISITSEGTATAQPDTATINVGVQEQATSAQEAMTKHNTVLNAIFAKLKDLKIDPKDYQTTGLSLNQDYDYNSKQLRGYFASSSITVHLNDITTTGATLDALVGAGANRVGGISFTVKDYDNLHIQALGNAMNSAQAKADVIAKAMNGHVTGVREVIEAGSNRPMPQTMAMDSAPVGGASSAGNMPIATGQLTAVANITVIYNVAKN